VGGDAVAVLDATSKEQLRRLEIPAVMAAALSPKGTFLLTFQRPSKDESGAGVARKRSRLSERSCRRASPTFRPAQMSRVAVWVLVCRG
jgi:hypothetical protein